MSGSSLKARQLNSLLDDVRTSLKNHFHDIETHEAYVTAEKVRNAFLGITVRQQTLLGTFRKHNEDVQKLVGISKSAATYAKYDRCMRRLEEFMQAKYRIKDIALKEISHVFITDFETYLRTESRCNENTTAKFMQTFRMIYHHGEEQRVDFRRSVYQLQNSFEKGGSRLSDRTGNQENSEEAIYLQAIGAGARYFHLFVFHGIGLYRCAEFDKRQHPHLFRRQTVDYDGASEDRYRRNRTLIKSAAGYFEKV